MLASFSASYRYAYCTLRDGGVIERAMCLVILFSAQILPVTQDLTVCLL